MVMPERRGRSGWVEAHGHRIQHHARLDIGGWRNLDHFAAHFHAGESVHSDDNLSCPVAIRHHIGFIQVDIRLPV